MFGFEERHLARRRGSLRKRPHQETVRDVFGKEDIMKSIRALIKKHPLLGYYVLTFAISWGGFLIAAWVGTGGFSPTPEQLQAMIPYAVPAMLLGPSVAGILLIGLVDGRAGLREFLSRLLKWRVGARWYALALLTAPLVFGVALLALSLTSPVYLPRLFTTSDKVALILMGIAVGLGAGIFEELGWTGFAIPTMRLRYGVLATGLFVGVLWGVWHFFMNFWASGVTSGELSLAIFVPTELLGILVGQLVAFRVLMVWVYDRTESLLLAMLMHVSFAASTIILLPPAPGVASVMLSFVPAAAMWVVVGVVAVANGWHLTRGPLRRRVA
jgi:membrane protease YdiL (CAAX protease family)